MIGKLRVLGLAVLAVGVFGVLDVSGAQGAEERFHCSVQPCSWTLKQDGTSKTAHQVFEVTDKTNTVSFTCNELKGHATSATKTTNQLTFTGLEYAGCSVAGGGAVKVRMNACAYNFVGTAEAKGDMTIECEGTKKIEYEIEETKCIVTIGSTEDLPGLQFHNIGEEAKTTTETTVETNVSNVPVTADGTKEQCGVDPAKSLTGHYSTGNSIITGENDLTLTMANAWTDLLGEFHCSAEPCSWTLKQDGTSKTAHQVFEVTDKTNTVSFTCNELKGHATSATKTTNQLTFTGLEYAGCSVAGGGAVKVRMNACAYNFVGTAEAKGDMTIECEGTKKIEYEIEETKCIVTIGSTEDLPGLQFHNIGEEAKTTTETTVETNVSNVPVTADGTKEQCGVDPAKSLTGHYSTGNSIITGENDLTLTMANAWYA